MRAYECPPFNRRASLGVLQLGVLHHVQQNKNPRGCRGGSMHIAALQCAAAVLKRSIMSPARARAVRHARKRCDADGDEGLSSHRTVLSCGEVTIVKSTTCAIIARALKNCQTRMPAIFRQEPDANRRASLGVLQALCI